MAKSKIVITFSDGMDLGDSLTFKYTNVDTGVVKNFNHFWIDIKYAKGHVQRGEVGGIYDNLMCAGDYKRDFQVDYNVPALFTVVQNGNEVTITSLIDNVEFSDFVRAPEVPDPNPAPVTAVITNAALVSPLTYTLEYLEATANCADVKVRVTASEIVTSVTSPVSLSPASTVFEFDWIRGVPFTLAFTDGTNNVSDSQNTPSVLLIPTTKVVNKPSGASVIISVNNPDLTLQYSVNGVDYQDSSLFQPMVVGSYTAYVKDQFNCVKSSTFDIDAFTPYVDVLTPIFYYSNANSIRLKKVEVWDDREIYKTDENTLSFEEKKLRNGVVHPYIQRWQTNDLLPNQFISSYGTHTIKILDNGAKIPITATKKSNNIGLKDKRDARIFKMEDNKTGVYFISGNIYDYDTGVVTGSYQPNSELPEWAVINRTVFIDEIGDYLILENIIDDPAKGQVLVFTEGYVGIEKNTTVQTIYNLFDTEVYEFDIDMSTYNNKFIQISIDISDTNPDFPNISYLSEAQHILEIQKGTIEVKYWSDEDNDIIYQYGIKHTLRLEYASFKTASENEREVHKMDTNVIPISGSHFNKKELSLVRLSTKMADKAEQAFGQQYVLLNRQSFVTDSIDSPEVLGQSNMHNLKINLFKNVEQVESAYNDVGIIIPEIPQSPSLIDFGSGFLSVK